MSTIGINEKANKHVKDVCRMGQGASCCKYLVMGKAWECMKADPKNKKVIDDNWAKHPHVAQGDNCPGFGKTEAEAEAETELCSVCNGSVNDLNEMHKKSIAKYGWYAHYVFNDTMCPTNTNAHTHHLEKSFGHKDLQVCLNIEPSLIHMLFTNAIDHIKKGVKYEAGKKYDHIIEGYQVEFIDAVECDRQVLRMLIPDKNGKYEGVYREQLTMLNNTPLNLNLN